MGKTLSGSGCWIPSELHRPGVTPSTIDTFRRYDRLARIFGDRGTWCAAKTLARMGSIAAGKGGPESENLARLLRAHGVTEEEFPDVGVSTIQVGTRVLIGLGWLVRADGIAQGKTVEVLWCRWLIPPDDPDGQVVDFGHGFRYRHEDGSIAPGGDRAGRRPAARAGGADAGAGRADPPPPEAQASAPIRSKEFKTGEREETLPRPSASSSAPLVEESKTPVATPDPDPVPPAPPAARAPEPPKASVDELLQILSGPLGKGGFAARAVWDLIELGREDLVPERFRGEKRPSRPDPEAGPSRPSPRPPAAPARAATVAEAATLVEAIRLMGPAAKSGAGEAEVEIVAEWIGDKYGDGGWENAWKSHLRGVVAGKIPADQLADLFALADRSNEANKPAFVQRRLKKQIARGFPPLKVRA